jgi:hypothetical protein
VFRCEHEQVGAQQPLTTSRPTFQSSCAASPFQTAVIEPDEEYETYGAF